MRLPKRGVSVDKLRCKICKKSAEQQDNDPKKCDKEHCPFKAAKDV